MSKSGYRPTGVNAENSGNTRLVNVSPGRAFGNLLYDRGELLYLAAQAMVITDADLVDLAERFDLSGQEVRDVLSMAD